MLAQAVRKYMMERRTPTRPAAVAASSSIADEKFEWPINFLRTTKRKSRICTHAHTVLLVKAVCARESHRQSRHNIKKSFFLSSGGCSGFGRFAKEKRDEKTVLFRFFLLLFFYHCGTGNCKLEAVG